MQAAVVGLDALAAADDSEGEGEQRGNSKQHGASQEAKTRRNASETDDNGSGREANDKDESAQIQAGGGNPSGGQGARGGL